MNASRMDSCPTRGVVIRGLLEVLQASGAGNLQVFEAQVAVSGNALKDHLKDCFSVNVIGRMDSINLNKQKPAGWHILASDRTDSCSPADAQGPGPRSTGCANP